ncbi:MFS general substrate transporter [Aspergillus ellipticus CBS 707.79]|uniref:MFS general substrate transporter n=1 Tax=Aspergillus ellipticus CBS 707.79 TaxID=1448320 RepID=A0A319D1T1_9EURO|nr:MFS general substrate transporter [Aspergillus ellipticus CBS 707.79]
MPLIVKYGRRPIYVISFVLYVGTGLWAGFAKTYSVELVGRLIMGLSSGAGECLGPMTISDLFFLHERGAVMALYTAALAMGVSGGIIIDGLITINRSWRYIYYIATALIGSLTVLVIFTFPETTFDRQRALEEEANPNNSRPPDPQSKESYFRSLRLFNGTPTSESLFRILLRPIVLIILPPVLWTSLVFAVTIGFLVAITSNFATAFSEAYNFSSWKSGLCFISGLIGSILGIAFGGHLSDWTADWFTRRNGGIRHPEMRLPSVVIGGVCAPVSLILYGVGINNQLHWIVPTVGLGLLNFAIGQATNVTMVYVIDSYRPAVGEATVSILAFKSAFGFLLSFYTNPWVDLEGYTLAYAEMACISGVIIALSAVFFFWGKWIRYRSWKWRVMEKYAHWGADRETGG